MNDQLVPTYHRAAKWIASIFGILAGVGGATHGIGEILQGNMAPTGIIINSWTEGPIATYLGGDPGMTVVPKIQTRIIPGAGHDLTFVQADVVNKTILEFLQ